MALPLTPPARHLPFTRMTPSVHLRSVFVVMALGCFTLFLAVPLVVAAAVLILAPPDVSIWVAPGAVAFAAGIGYAMSSGVQWAELDGGVIRWRSLLTRRVREKAIADIVAVTPLNSAAGPLENAILTAATGTSNRGYELRFRDGARLGLVRSDMAGLDEFLKVLAVEIASRCGNPEAPAESSDKG